MEQESPSPNQCYSKYTENLQYETIYTIYDMMPTTHIKYTIVAFYNDLDFMFSF